MASSVARATTTSSPIWSSKCVAYVTLLLAVHLLSSIVASANIGSSNAAPAEHLDWTELQQHAHNAPESEQPKQSLQLEQPKQQQQQQQQQVVAFESTTVSQDDKVIQPELKQGSGKLSRPNNNVEKLKRGLTNFMNQLNPAPFFVPSHYHEQQAADPQAKLNGKEANEGGKVTLGSGKLATQLGPQPSAELAAIVNADPSVDVLIKGPIRVAQTRPIGGPLRWGRRR